MKTVKASGLMGLAVLATITAGASPLAMAEDLGWYGGANIGRSATNIDDPRITSGLAAGGLGTSSISDRDRSTGFKLYGGYQFHRNFALEGGYFDLGKFGYTANTIPTGTLDGNIKLKGFNLDAVGILPITERFSALGRVGLNYAQARDSFTGTGAVNVTNPNPSKSGTNYKLGVGLQYAFTDALGLRAEVERYRVNDAVGNKGHVDLFSVGSGVPLRRQAATGSARVRACLRSGRPRARAGRRRASPTATTAATRSTDESHLLGRFTVRFRQGEPEASRKAATRQIRCRPEGREV